MLFNRYFYCLKNQLKSPTSLLLAKQLKQQGWKKALFKQWADFSEDNLEFNQKAAQSLEFKHLFAELCKKYCSDSIPATYTINDHNWPELLSHLAEHHYPGNDLVWILKPALLNNGQGMYLFQRLDEIEDHYLGNKRLGGPHVLQQYLTNPHLLKGPRDGHKYSLRLFVILSNSYGAFLYPQGYFNIALYPYKAHDYNDLNVHLTNEHLSHDQPNVVQIPTWQYELFKPFYPQIKVILSRLFRGLKIEYPQAFECEKKQELAIFGMDFMVDAHEKVWLIEANHGPCFPTTPAHPLQKNLYDPFWQELVEAFIVNNTKCKKTFSPGSFEPLLWSRV